MMWRKNLQKGGHFQGTTTYSMVCKDGGGKEKNLLYPGYTWWLQYTYLIIANYFSHYTEVIQMTSTTSTTVIRILKSIFLNMESLQSSWVIMVHNLLQEIWRRLLTSIYGSELLTTIPCYPQSNGLVEQTIKTCWKIAKILTWPF